MSRSGLSQYLNQLDCIRCLHFKLNCYSTFSSIKIVKKMWSAERGLQFLVSVVSQEKAGDLMCLGLIGVCSLKCCFRVRSVCTLKVKDLCLGQLEQQTVSNYCICLTLHCKLGEGVMTSAVEPYFVRICVTC